MQNEHEDQQSHKSAGFAVMDDAQKIVRKENREEQSENKVWALPEWTTHR